MRWKEVSGEESIMVVGLRYINTAPRERWMNGRFGPNVIFLVVDRSWVQVKPFHPGADRDPVQLLEKPLQSLVPTQKSVGCE